MGEKRKRTCFQINNKTTPLQKTTMKTTITVEFPKPKTKPKRKAYPYKRECEALVGRYFILDGKAGYIYKATSDRDKKCWVVWFRYVSPYSRTDYEGMHAEGIYDSDVFQSSTLYGYREFDNATEITAESYKRIRQVCKMAATALKATISSEEQLYKTKPL